IESAPRGRARGIRALLGRRAASLARGRELQGGDRHPDPRRGGEVSRERSAKHRDRDAPRQGRAAGGRQQPSEETGEGPMMRRGFTSLALASALVAISCGGSAPPASTAPPPAPPLAPLPTLARSASAPSPTDAPPPPGVAPDWKFPAIKDQP